MEEKSSGTVVFHKGKSRLEYLLLHYESGHWDFPKGHIERNETEEEAAKRELMEETGLTGVLMGGFREKISYMFRHQNSLVRKDVVFFVAEAKKKKVILSHEHTGFEWLAYDEALDRLTFKNAKGILKKADAFLKSTLRDFA